MTHFLFSGGEVHLNHEPSSVVKMTDYTMNGFMAACMQNEISRRNGVKEVHLFMPYIPYARQDRVMVQYEPFSLKVFCEMLNAQKFATVHVYDPHSDVAPALINNVYVVPQWTVARPVLADLINDPAVLFVSPDAGAFKKLSKLITDDSRIVIGTKHRATDGKITHSDFFSPVDIMDKHCVMVDDICDGGRTFTALSHALKQKGASKVSLYVTHGIFSQGLDALANIDHIYTTNSFPQKDDPRLTVHNII